MANYIWKNPITTATVQSNKRHVIHQGGTYSLKTFGNLMALIQIIHNADRKLTATVAAASYPLLKKGVRRDFVDIMQDLGVFNKKHWNMTDGLYKLGEHGGFIEFLSVDSVGKAKMSKRDYLLLNEADLIPYEIARQLMNRTRIKVIIEFNPTEAFWVQDKVMTDQSKYDFFRSNFLHTLELEKRFGIEIIPQGLVNELLESRETDPEYFKIYGLGLQGNKKGRAIKKLKVCASMPPLDECKWRAIGIDYGYTADPTVIVDVRFSRGEIWVNELLYETGVGEELVSGHLEGSGIQRRKQEIYPDASEKWGNAELRVSGWNIKDVDNSAGSVRHGMSIVNRYVVNVTAHSKNVLKDCRQHKRKFDEKAGEYTNDFENKHKHGVDAIRYPVMMKLYLPAKGKQKYAAGNA